MSINVIRRYFRQEVHTRIPNSSNIAEAGSSHGSKASADSRNSPQASSSSSDQGSPSSLGSSNQIKLDNTASETSNTSSKDETYWEKRKKNNEAARRSRNVRKAKEQETALRAELLEKENEQMKLQLSILTSHIMACSCQPHATTKLKLCLQNN